MVQRRLFLVVTVEFARWVPPRQLDRNKSVVMAYYPKQIYYLKKQKLARLSILHAFTSNSDHLSAGIVYSDQTSIASL